LAIQGCIDVCISSYIAGWIWDTDNPERHFDVQLVIGEQHVATLEARDYRDELARAGINDGTYVFSYIPPEEVDLGKEIFACVDGSDVRIRPLPPTCAIALTPAVISPGESAELSWICERATHGTVNQGIGEAEGPSRTVSVTPFRTTTYIGMVYGPGGTSCCQGTVIVDDPANASLAKRLGPIAPEHLRERVAGTSNENWWDAGGARTVDEWHRALQCLNMDFRELPTVLDFGCGGGRALRHLALRLSNRQHLYAADVDHEQVAWLRANYPEITSIGLGELPPSSLPSSSVDLIVSNSVFTHLPEEVARAWLSELERILRKGGILITTIHGGKAIDYTSNWIALKDRSEAERLTQNISRFGFHYIAGKNSSAEQALPEYYGSAFHHIGYIAREWTELFEILAWLPAFALGYQDTLVVKKK